MPPSVAGTWRERARRDALAAAPCRVREVDGHLQLIVDDEHPDAIAMLFELFTHGAGAQRTLALEALDQRFAGWAEAPAPDTSRSGVFSFVQGVLGNDGETSVPRSRETERVQHYRQIWQRQAQEAARLPRP